MMRVAISQSVGKSYYQYDFLYDNYTKYLEGFGLELKRIPNFATHISLDNVQGVILTGGNSVNPRLYNSSAAVAGISDERDRTERRLLEAALEKNLPVLGICRGMQMINVFFGGKLRQLETKDHVAKEHGVELLHDKLIALHGKSIRVNSFHDEGLALEDLSPQLRALALSDDSLIEGLYHPSKRIAGVMWHPEREGGSVNFNSSLIKAFREARLFWQ